MCKGFGYHSRISQTTLNNLAKNCPKLLRLFGYSRYLSPIPPFIFAQRMNAATEFRLAHQILKEVDGKWLQLDYDSSVEDLTDEESTSIATGSSDEEDEEE
jgi:hypothetical protein